jgi:hypothetical protein
MIIKMYSQAERLRRPSSTQHDRRVDSTSAGSSDIRTGLPQLSSLSKFVRELPNPLAPFSHLRLWLSTPTVTHDESHEDFAAGCDSPLSLNSPGDSLFLESVSTGRTSTSQDTYKHNSTITVQSTPDQCPSIVRDEPSFLHGRTSIGILYGQEDISSQGLSKSSEVKDVIGSAVRQSSEVVFRSEQSQAPQAYLNTFTSFSTPNTSKLETVKRIMTPISAHDSSHTELLQPPLWQEHEISTSFHNSQVRSPVAKRATTSQLHTTLADPPLCACTIEDGIQSIATSSDTASHKLEIRTLPIRKNAPLTNIPDFRQIQKGVFEATKLRPEPKIQTQWTTVWQATLNKKLINLHLGQNAISNMRLCLVGSSPDAESMRSTILLICPEAAKKRIIESNLKEFIKITISASVEFRVITRNVKLSSGGSGLPSIGGSFVGLEVKLRKENEGAKTLVGSVIRVQKAGFDSVESCFPISTVGGMISISGRFYALTVAHSLFSKALPVDQDDDEFAIHNCGTVDLYIWCGSDDYLEVAKMREACFEGMDWMLFSINPSHVVPNTYQVPVVSHSPHSSLEDSTNLYYTPSNIWDIDMLKPRGAFIDEEVWICAGMTKAQTGYLDSLSSTITYGNASYEVFPIALESELSKLASST